MKKHLFLALLLGFISINSDAQITFYQDHFPASGTTQFFAADTLDFSGIDLGNGGANQTWDFTSLSNHIGDTIKYLNPGWTAFSSNFPYANIVIWQGLELMVFGNNGPNGMELQGYVLKYGGQEIPFPFEDTQRFLKYPLTYQTSFVDDSKLDHKVAIQAFPGADSVRLKTLTHFDNQVDAYGSLTTPAGTYNVLRMKVVETTLDSVWGHLTLTSQWQYVDSSADTSYRYEFLALGIGSVSTIHTDTFGNPLLATYLLASSVGVKELAKGNRLSIYPNPSTGRVSIDNGLKESGVLVVSDINGREVARYNIKPALNSIEMEGITAGTYLYSFLSLEGKVLNTGKFNW